MHKIFIIAKREYLERIRTKSFIIMTFFIPALMLGVTVLPSLMMKGSGGSKHLLVVASDRRMGELIRQQLNKLSSEQKQQTPQPEGLQRPNLPQTGNLTVEVDTDTSSTKRTVLAEKVKQKQLDGVIFATRDALVAKKVTFLTRDVSSFIVNNEVQNALNEALRRDLLKNKGMTEEEIDNALEDIKLGAESPSGATNPEIVFFTIFSMAVILYMTVLLYGTNVMRAILEEKNSRVMEVLLASAQAKEMMAGKILGVGAVGLTQIAIWAAMVTIPSSVGLIAAAPIIKSVLSARLLVYLAVFFLLGFAVYSTLCAAVGAMVNSEQEAQQPQFIVMMPMIVAIIIMVEIIQYPAGSTALWASLFPLTAPLIMFLRIALGSPPWWEIALSIGLMMATIYGLVWACGRIYRVGILMYGKRPTLPEIMKWIRYP